MRRGEALQVTRKVHWGSSKEIQCEQAKDFDKRAKKNSMRKKVWADIWRALKSGTIT